MSIIKRLSPEVASKIAAGEVVEKPFNVVKELIENSCDAGATKIIVEINEGGLNKIKVTDNGKGIDKDDLPLALERFATSKAETVEDVYSAATFGFRGEALAAISSVSDFKITSGKDGKAYTITCQYGKIGEIKPTAAVKGTIIEADRLFENLPARRKFLKSSKSLEAEIVKLIKHFSLINPDIDITLKCNDKEVYHALSTDDTAVRAAKVFSGKAFCQGVAEYAGKKVIACATLPSASDRLKRDAIIIGVNGRLIKDTSLVQAVINAYHRLIPDGRFPAAVIDIRISPDIVDANVHPAKLEVRFVNAGEMFSLVSDAVANSFKGKGVNTGYTGNYIQQGYTINEKQDNKEQSNVEYEKPVENKPVFNKDNSYKTFSEYKSSSNNTSYNNSPKAAAEESSEIKMPQPAYTLSLDETLEDIPVVNNDNKEALNSNADTLDSRIAGGEFRVVGQVDKTYIIIETPNKEILFIDQHAAHERILFEKIQSDNAAKPKPSIVLHDVVEVVMTDEIIENIDRYKVIIESFGYAYKITGIDKLEILRVPYNIIRKNIAKEFTNIAADLCLTGKSKQEEAPRAMLSCKSAIKAGDELTYAEMEYLVTLLFNTDNFGTCPHGRPIIYMMTVQELARKFYR
ncbi:MAG: DNA mismatch repair endonuclease MutL [Mucispirillum sp.]|nr:DNA mismatch repair endonuclease MutL [Mucispirillum sp.]